MKVTGEIKIKDDLKRYDYANAIDMAVDIVIHETADGDISYNPSYTDFGMLCGIAFYLVDGIEFEDSDNYSTIESNEELKRVIEMFLLDEYRFKDDFYELLDFRIDYLMDNRNKTLREAAKKAFESAISANTMLEKVAEMNLKLTKKQLEIAEKNEEVAEQMTPEEIAEMNRMLINGKLNLDDVAESIIGTFTRTSLSDARTNEIIDAKNAQIRELQAYKTKTEKERQARLDDGK